MLDEVVRGTCPDASLFSLPGLEQLRAYLRHQLPGTPLYHLLGCRSTQGNSGAFVVKQPLTAWFDVNHGFAELMPTAEFVLHTTALTGAPAGVMARTINLSLRYLRPCTVDEEAVVARGRILHAGSSFTTVEVLIEDAQGRSVAHVAGSVVFREIDPPPPPLSRPLEVVDDPTYATPDPPFRPLTSQASAGLPAGQDPAVVPPMGELLGVTMVHYEPGAAHASMPSSPWFALLHPEVAPGVIGSLGNIAANSAITSARGDDQRMVVISHSVDFLKAVPTDGRTLTAVARGRRPHR